MDSRCGVAPHTQSPAFWRSRGGPPPTAVTKREAIGLLQRPGHVAGKIGEPAFLSSRRLRNRLKINGSIILRRINEFSSSASVPFLNLDHDQLGIDIINGSRRLPDTYAFHPSNGYCQNLPRCSSLGQRSGRVRAVITRSQPSPILSEWTRDHDREGDDREGIMAFGPDAANLAGVRCRPRG